MRNHISFIFGVILGVTSGCSGVDKVPGVCCVTDAQCAAIQVDEERPCDVGQSCKGNLCVATECQTSAECADPNPVCSLGICIAGCQLDQDCADVPNRPVCSSGGTCVGCEDASQCPAEAAICDAATHACRGCTGEADCPGGVCLEADGVCVADENVVFVSSPGATSGNCDRASPCESVAIGVTKANATRRVIHLVSGSVEGGSGTVTFSSKGIYLDGNDTVVNGAVLDISGQANVTLSRIRTSFDVLVRGPNAIARLFGVESTAAVSVDSSSVTIIQSHFASPPSTTAVGCVGGTLSIAESAFDSASIDTTNCFIHVLRSRFDASTLTLRGGKVLVENTQLVMRSGSDDAVFVNGASAGSAFRFNTVVNTTLAPSNGVAVCANNNLEVSSNVFAYRSSQPLGVGATCTTRATFSVFDEVAPAGHTAGTGNKTGDVNAFFVDRANLDLHLAADSPARGASDPAATVTEDLEGKPRPQPAGTAADSGAFEAP